MSVDVWTCGYGQVFMVDIFSVIGIEFFTLRIRWRFSVRLMDITAQFWAFSLVTAISFFCIFMWFPSWLPGFKSCLPRLWSKNGDVFIW